MDFPALYGVSKTMMLFYFESMIIFARNALDVAAYVYSDLLFDTRKDSFNDVIKKVKKSADLLLSHLKSFFDAEYNEEATKLSVLKLLCGTEKGRALRDTIVHQANLKMGYYEHKEDSEKEHLFIELKDRPPFDMDIFVENFTQDAISVLENFNMCCKRKLTEDTIH